MTNNQKLARPQFSSADEKLIGLRSVSLFAETPDEVIGEIAAILEEIHFKSGVVIINQGEYGDSMYMIVSGRVRIHFGERTLDQLGPGHVFGEMAALDPEPRSASVTALEDTFLYRLDGTRFYALLGNRMEIARGIIHILCEHLRARVQDLNTDYKYMQQFAKVTAAATAVEAGLYDPESLSEVGERTDALGQLARVFQHMVREVYAREERLKLQVQQLRIEIDEGRTARQIAAITDTDYFTELQARADQLRIVDSNESSGNES